MRKLIFALAVAAALASAPESDPALADGMSIRTRQVVGATLTTVPALERAFRWSTRQELRRISRDLEERDLQETLPRPEGFADYLREYHVTGRDGRDPWGVPYVLRVTAEAIEVRSAGPDQQPGTWDDIVEAASRR